MGRLMVIGIGAGNSGGMTVAAKEAIMACEHIYGYTVYIDLIRDLFPDKEMTATGMRKEQERCRMALDMASRGKCTGMVCSGDSGIYGMAGLLYEMAGENEAYREVEIHVVAGVTAAVSGGAVLGAPLSHDFAVISMSDLLTPYELIHKRIRMAAEGDFVICLYNPSSKKREDYLQKACDEVLKVRSPDTVCGYVRNIGRRGETAEILTLGELRNTRVDMFTTVFIGSSSTRRIGDKMVTPRGYQN